MSAQQHPLSIANFRYFWLARLASTLGQYAMLLIIGWQTYNLAREGGMSVAEASGQLALIGLLQFAPLFVLTPVSGLVADRYERKKIAQLMIGLQGLCALALAVLTYQDVIAVWMLFVISIVLGTVRAFSGPALSALSPNLVPRAILPNAIALSSIAHQSGNIVGPALGGLLYEVVPALPYVFAATTFTLSVVLLGFIGKVPRSQKPVSRHPIKEIHEGLVYVWQNKMVFSTITLDLFAVFLAGATALFPVYARDILQVGATGLSQLAMAPAIGAAVTAAWFSFSPLKHNVGPKMLISVAVFGIATIVFGLSRSMPLSLVMLAIVGAADMFSVYIRQSLIQLHTPDDKRGRVSAVSQMTISASNEFGDFFSGSLAYLFGPVIAVVAGGAGAILTVAAWTGIYPVLRQTKTFDQPDHLLEEEQNNDPKARGDA